MAQSRSLTRGTTRSQLSLLRENIKSVNPAAAATLRNATPKDGRQPSANELTAGEERSIIMPHKLQRISDIIANNINATNDLRAITPYIDRAELIWSSLLLYPNGKQTNILEYSTRPSRFKNTLIHNALLKVWKDHFTNDYKIEDELKDIVNDILWNTGSYATLTMSRVSLDYLINGMEVVDRKGNEDISSVQVFQKTAGNFTYDQNTKKLRVMNIGNYVRAQDDKKNDVFNVQGLESMLTNVSTSSQAEFNILQTTELANNGFFINFTDNPAVLATNLLSQKRKKFNEKFYSGAEDFSSIINKAISNESARKTDSASNKKVEEEKGSKGTKDPKKPNARTTNMSMTDLNNIQNQIFPHRKASNQFIQFVKQDTDFAVENFGTPIDWHVPSASIIPIHINGNVRKKKDFIILIDPDTGDFLNPTTDFQYYQSSKKNQDGIANKNSQGSTNGLIDNLKQIQQGKDCDFDMSEFAMLSKGLIIEQFMKSIISNRSGNISIDLDEETNKIFLSRMLKGQGVRALYVPGECITYAAIKYGPLGTGQSLTQLAKMQIARLAAIDLADAMANMEAAQSTNKMRITLDKDDPNPERTIAMAREVFFRANPRFYNVLATSQMSIPVLVDAFKELSLTLEVDSGENPYMPAPQVEVSPMERNNFRKVDPESRNEVLNKISNYFMLPKGWLDVADDNNNFQIEALTEHRLVYNQAINWQDEIAGFVKEREIKYARVNHPLLVTLVEVINENKQLWKSDVGDEIEGGTDAEKIQTILEDFLNSIECSLPVPSVMEAASKIKDGLNTVTDLVTQWWEATGKKPMVEKALKDLNIGEDYSPEDIEARIKAHLYTKAHKYLNIPSPFDDAVDDPTGGGIATIVESVVTQNTSLMKFLSELAIRDMDERSKNIKKTENKIEKGQTKLQNITGDGADENALPGENNLPLGGGDSTEPTNDDDIPPDDATAATDLPPDDNTIPEEENTDDDTPQGDESTNKPVVSDTDSLSKDKEGKDPFGG